MILNWKNIKDNWSVKDIEIFINKNLLQLNSLQLTQLRQRITQMRKDNAKFVDKLFKNQYFRLALLKQKNKETANFAEAFKDMETIRNYCVKQEQETKNIKKRWANKLK